ncbi:MAG TPA: twin-arginine translocase TatA/TatE family subunit [Kofleriaceae bacterium]|nr:twin-arginine translocase TatA/TatE family subunit [Kofleriaceae bacterium]
MFGMGGSEILVILIVALLFLGPDKLPDAAKKISKGIRDIKRQSRALQQTIEDDEHIGGALRDLRSALRGEEAPPVPPKPKLPKQIEGAATPDPVAQATALAAATEAPAGAAEAAEAKDAAGVAAADPAKDPHEQDAEVAATAFADTFETSHMTSSAPTAPTAEPAAEAPPARAITLPPTAGEPAESTSAPSHADADLAALVKPAPNTIARGATTSAASASAASASTASASTASASAEPSSAASASTAPATEPAEPEHG